MRVGSRVIGAEHPALITAECGINHNGELDLALRLIEAAAGAGAEAMKFQLFRAAGMYTPRAGLYRTATGAMMPIYSLMEELELPLEWIPHLSRACRDHGVLLIMTVCDEWCVQVMADFDFDAYKVASYEVGHLPMLAELAGREQPVFMSTGAATLGEVEEALAVLGDRTSGLFQCTAKYPAPEESLNLSVIESYAARFPQCVPGFSDHSRDPLKAPVQAIYHGAKMIEKHFTLDRNLPGADHSFAVEPADLRALIRAVREAEERLAAGELPLLDPVLAGHPEKRVEPAEAGLRGFATRGVFTTTAIRRGETFSRDNLRVLRPGELPQGLHPRHFEELLESKTAARDLSAWHGLQWDDVTG